MLNFMLFDDAKLPYICRNTKKKHFARLAKEGHIRFKSKKQTLLLSIYLLNFYFIILFFTNLH